MKKLLIAALLCGLLTDLSYGAGFALYEFSGRSTAMGGAVMANDAEPASLAANPALITELDGTQVQLGGTLVSAHAKTTFAGQSRELKRDIWLLPNFYITHKWSDDISFGLGGFSRYGLGGEYKNPESWAGSMLAYKVKLETFSFTPTIAIKANDQLSMAMGLDAMVIGFSQNSNLAAGTPYASTGYYEISGSGTSWGGNFSLIYRPEWAEKWSVGAVYRTQVKQTLDGRINAGTYPGLAMYDILSKDAKGSITLPASLSTGISYRPDDKWTLEAGIVGTFWSSYDQILIEYKNDETAPTIHNKKEYKDVFRLNFGGEYKLNQNWAVRAGYVYDKSPINEHAMDTLVPVDDRHIGSVGFGYHDDTWSADFAYAHVFGRHLTGDSNAQFGDRAMRYSNGRGDMFSVTVGYKF